VLKRILIGLVVLVVVVGLAYAVRARGADERAEADAEPLFVPVIVSPSIQIVSGQVLLYKATNVSESPASFRLMLFNDAEGVPGTYRDFTRIPAGHTVSYVYEPPAGKLTLGTATVDAPEAVRATFAPLPAGDPGAIRRIVANVQIMRVQSGANASTLLDPPIVVPLERCTFEPRGFVPYTGGRWYWNCAPEMYPIDQRWRRGGQGNSGAR
jgi:hypothetical protein